MLKKKGESASSAAAFIALVTVIIILYILFLPPDYREQILNDRPVKSGNGTWNSNGGTAPSTEILNQKVGRVTYVNTREKNIDLLTMRISSPTEPQVLRMIQTFTIEHALFNQEKSSYTLEFPYDERTTENPVLTYNVRTGSGPLIISINGKEVFNDIINNPNPAPIKVDNAILQKDNEIVFKVPGSGWAFWKTNTYTIDGAQVIADVTNFDNSEGTQQFTITEAELDNLEKLALYFRPGCDLRSVGPLRIEVNKRVIYDAIADCDALIFANIDERNLLEGTNEVRFSTSKGTYLIDNVNIKINLEKPTYTTYLFELDNDYFFKTDEDARCGDYDGQCPAGCTDTRDADCCFRYNGFWCATPTSDSNDRCVYYVNSYSCGKCATGYYDRDDDAPSDCEDTCGVNDDGLCPSGCTEDQDQDCCYAADDQNFWCRETPVTGLNDKCRTNIRNDDCALCPSGFEDEDGDTPGSCDVDNAPIVTQEYMLQDDYDVDLTIHFVDGTERKRVDLSINGYLVTIDTREIEFERNIDQYIREGTNSLQIIPKEDLTIADIRVDVRKVK